MKTFLRVYIFVILGILSANAITDAISFGVDTPMRPFLLLALAIGLLYYFLRPLLGLIGFKTGGVIYIFFSFCLTTLILYILTTILPGLHVKTVTLVDISLFSLKLPAKTLNNFWSGVYSSLIICLVFTFMDWLCSSQKVKK